MLKKTSKIIGVLLIFLFLNSCASMMGLTEDIKQQLIERDIPIAIVYYDTGYPNSVGGVDAEISWVNISSKDIKYITFSVKPYNKVDDVVSSDIGNKIVARLAATGPFDASKTSPHHMTWGTVWYNNTIERLEIEKVEIIFMDDTTKSYSAPEILEMDYRIVQ